MADSNGRWRPPGDSHHGNNPEDDFPIRQSCPDWSGKERHFVISFQRVDLGYSVQAEEEGKEGQGFYFREFDPTSAYLALGRLRGRIRRALAMRHIEEWEPGVFQATHNTVRGRISYSTELQQVAFVVDGQLLTLEQFGKLAETFEGFQFRFDIFDSSDDVPQTRIISVSPPRAHFAWTSCSLTPFTACADLSSASTAPSSAAVADSCLSASGRLWLRKSKRATTIHFSNHSLDLLT